jgi:hypothetical protein
MFSIFMTIYMGVEFTGHMIILCLPFWGTAWLFLKLAMPFHIAPETNNAHSAF